MGILVVPGRLPLQYIDTRSKNEPTTAANKNYSSKTKVTMSRQRGCWVIFASGYRHRDMYMYCVAQ